MHGASRGTAGVTWRWALGTLLAAGMVGGREARGQSSVYVVNVASDDVSVIDAASRAVVASLPVGAQPNGVAVTPDGRRVYVPSLQANTVSVIDAATRTVVRAIGVGDEPVGIAVAPDGRRAYVTNRRSNSVSVIDTASDAVVATIDTGVGPGSNGIALTPDGARAYVNNASSRDPGTLSVIDTTTDRVVGTVEVSRNPKRVAIGPDGRAAYVANFRSWNISVVDTASDTLRTVLRVSDRTVGVAVHPNGQYAYITNLAGTVEILETSNNLLTVPIPVGREPYAIALSGRGGEAYVANLADDTVSVVDLGSDLEVATVPVGDKPFAIAWGCLGEGCDLPPFTPKPTRTVTPIPTSTSTPTITPRRPPTSTPVPDPNAARVRIGSASGRPGDSVEVSVTLDTKGQGIAGIQLDVRFDLRAAIGVGAGGKPDCTANPDIGKDVASSFEAAACSGDDCGVARFIVISLENTDPLPDGAELFTCRIAIASDATAGTYPLTVAAAEASTADGLALPLNGDDGLVAVLAPGAAQRLRQGAEMDRRCSAGAADGKPCADDSDCRGGACVIAAGVCDGGADDGLLCDCPGGVCEGEGSCAGNASLGTCRGGRADGACCDRDFACSGGRACLETARTCDSGVGKGLPCLRDQHCPGSVCRASGRFCAGGEFDRFACVDDQDCPRGSCSVAGTPSFTPTSVTRPPTPGDPADAAMQSGSGGGCAIDPAGTGILPAWVAMIPVAALVGRARRRRG